MKITLFALTVCVALLSLSGCALMENKRPNVNKEGNPYHIGLVLSNRENPFFELLANGAMNEAQNQGVKLTVVDSKDNSDTEYAHIQGLVESRVDFIVVNPVDSDTVYKTIQYANDADIPVLTVDRTANGGQVVCHIASDNQAGGALIAEYLLERSGNKGSYAEMRGLDGTSAAQTRSKGFNDVMLQKSNMSQSAVVTADFNRQMAKEVMANLLVVHPKLTAIFAHNDEMALGASEVALSLNKDVLIFGFDGTDEALQAVENGTLAATVAQQPIKMGETSILRAIDFLSGKAIESEVLVDVKLIKKTSN